jgi:hypothetical protein
VDIQNRLIIAFRKERILQSALQCYFRAGRGMWLLRKTALMQHMFLSDKSTTCRSVIIHLIASAAGKGCTTAWHSDKYEKQKVKEFNNINTTSVSCIFSKLHYSGYMLRPIRPRCFRRLFIVIVCVCVCVIRTNKMYTFTIVFYFNYSVFDMFRTSKCSSSGRLVHAILWYFFHASV